MHKHSRMGVKHRLSSEYRHSFKSKYPSFTPTYEKNLDYRIQRRSVEHDHQVDPFLWDSSSSGSNSEVSLCTDIPKGSLKVPSHVYKHEKYNKAHRDRLNQLKEQFEQNLHVSESNGQLQVVVESTKTHHEETQTDTPPPPLELAELLEPEEIDAEVQIEAPQQPSKPRAATSGKRMRKPVISTGAPTHSVARPCRAKSASSKPRPASVPVTPAEVAKAPFLPYGYRDREAQTGAKKTYNIRASADIYPSALLAQKRRQATINRKEEDAKSASLREKRKKALFNEFNEKVRRDTCQWATEYSSKYPGYDQGVYQQARPASRQHTPAFLGATCCLFSSILEDL